MTTVLERPVATVTTVTPPAPTMPAPRPVHVQRARRRYLAVGATAAVVGIAVGFGLGYVSRNDEVARLEATTVTTLAPLAQSEAHDYGARVDIAVAVPGLDQTLPHDVAARLALRG